MGSEGGRWRIALAIAIAVLCAVGAPRVGHALDDEGDRGSLVEALSRARTALPRDATSRRDGLARLIRELREGRSVESALGAYGSRGEPVSVLLTGYYEPVLDARREASARFRHPLYRVPADPAFRARPRREIDAGALSGRGLEILWLDDPVESFFLHVQGSGRVRLGDGTWVRVGYGGNNGHAYHSIGSELVARGEMTVEEATAPGIKAWLRSHPAEMLAILHTNPRYVFFREIGSTDGSDGAVGPAGAMGAALVPMRSVAVDPDVTPLGSVGLLEAPLPDGTTFRRAVVAMDTGAAIRGPGRIDLFTGAGSEAGALAGVLRARGRVRWLP